MRKVTFDIDGMTCSSCSAHVERAVNGLSGIKSVGVNLLQNRMVAEFDEGIIDEGGIIQAVKDAGYGASLHDEKKVQIEKKKDVMLESICGMKRRLIISACFLVPLMYLAMHHMFFEWFGLPIPGFMLRLFHGNENAVAFGLTQFLLLLPILFVNRQFFVNGFKRLFRGSPNMDSLIAIGSGAATVYGVFAIYMIGYGLGHGIPEIVLRYSMDLYFESAGTILTLITFGKYLETKSKGKTGDAIRKLMNLAPKTAIVLREGKEVEVSTEQIATGDIVVIKPGGSIPVDGVVTEGSSSVNQASITGESIPVEKSVGDSVISGTINKNGSFLMKATKVGENTTLSQIIKLVEEASNSKAPISKIADRVSAVFVPVVITIAVISTVVWLLAGQSFEFALTTGIAVLVISCPCALGLATPVAIMVGTGKGAENGILIKSAESLELLHLVDTVVFDKTGTVTEGKPKVTDIICKADKNELLKIAGSLEKKSEHPLADAVLEKVNDEKLDLLEVKDFLSVSGRGVKGKIDEKWYFGGNLAFMKENKVNTDVFEKECRKLAENGKTLLYFAKDNTLIGVIAVADTVKRTAKSAIEELKNEKIEVVMLTGDNKLAAEAIGKSLGISNVIAEVLPQDKEKEVSRLQEQGKKVAFVGDGINDSPALVRADVGLAIGSGTDIAMESADVVLMRDNLNDVPTAISLSRAVIRNIKINLFWAFFYNAIGIPVAAGVFYNVLGWKLNPMIGAAAMSFSSVCVVTNALRLRKFKAKNIEEEKDMVQVVEIEGMMCNHCKMTVEKVLGRIDGVNSVEVNLEEKTATMTVQEMIEESVIWKVIEEEGFEVKKVR